MNTLWTFGDSFTSDLDHNKLHDNYKKYFEITNTNKIVTWPTILGEKLNFNVKNLALGGLSNYDTFQSICDNSDMFMENDIVIIGWGLVGKFRIARGGEFVSIFPDINNVNDIELISKETIVEFIENRLIQFDTKRDRYAEEVHIWENIIRTLSKNKKFKVYFWSSEEPRLLNDKSSIHIKKENYLFPNVNKPIIHYLVNDLNCKTIFDETNSIVSDNHFGNEGHKLQAEIFYNIVKNG